MVIQKVFWKTEMEGTPHTIFLGITLMPESGKNRR